MAGRGVCLLGQRRPAAQPDDVLCPHVLQARTQSQPGGSGPPWALPLPLTSWTGLEVSPRRTARGWPDLQPRWFPALAFSVATSSTLLLGHASEQVSRGAQTRDFTEANSRFFFFCPWVNSAFDKIRPPVARKDNVDREEALHPTAPAQPPTLDSGVASGCGPAYFYTVEAVARTAFHPFSSLLRRRQAGFLFRSRPGCRRKGCLRAAQRTGPK